MIGFRLVDPTSARWAIVHLSAKQPGRWQVTYGDELGPSGDTCRDCPQACIDLALGDGLVLTEARGDGAEAIAAEVNDHRAAMRAWLDADDWTAEMPRPTWAT